MKGPGLCHLVGLKQLRALNLRSRWSSRDLQLEQVGELTQLHGLDLSQRREHLYAE